MRSARWLVLALASCSASSPASPPASGSASPPAPASGSVSGSGSASGSVSVPASVSVSASVPVSASGSESESVSASGSVSGSGSGSGSGSASASASVSVSVSDSSSSPDPSLSVIEWPLHWSPERDALTLQYRRAHESAQAQDLEISPRVIVLHYTAGGSARATKRYFDRPTIEEGRAQLSAAGRVNVSSHFLIDRQGKIFRLQPETRFARHCIGLNHLAIGIENVGDEARWPLTEAQVIANAALVRDLVRRFPITHLLGHHEVMQFRAHPYYVERDPSYRNRKGDPGPRFVAAVRARLDDLALSGLPATTER